MALGVTLVLLLASHAAPVQAAPGSVAPGSAVVEQLRLRVPAEERQAWVVAERGSWEPWLARQPGFLERQLLWDPTTEEGTVLIRWADRQLWKGIAPAEVQAVQQRFEELARDATGRGPGNPFPLVFEGELLDP